MSDPSQPCIYRFEARAYSRATEISDKVKRALLNIFPETIHEHVSHKEEVTEGHHKNPIHILTMSAEESHAEQTLRFIFSNLTKYDIESLLKTLDRRIEEDCSFFLRIDKQAAYNGNIELAIGLDVIRCHLYIRRYPKCRPEDAKSLIERYALLAGESSE